LTALKDHEAGRDSLNISARLAADIGDTIKRIDGTEVPLLAPWGRQSGDGVPAEPARPKPANRAKGKAADETGVTKAQAPATSKAKPVSKSEPKAAKSKAAKPKAAPKPAAAAPEVAESEPELLKAARGGQADDLKRISGVGPKLEGVLNDLGFYHFDQIAAWGPAEVAWVDARLTFKGRIERDDWIAQAKALAAE
jgi:NADH-quinone oxidoreductase subunit E